MLKFTPTCSSGTWSTGQVDVSSIANGTGISVTADHDNASAVPATQATTTVNKATTTPTVSALSVASTLSDSANLSWNLNDPGGFTIDDYIINYRVKNTSTWLLFNDGVSTNTSASVTGLNDSTTYEFRVAVIYDTSNQSSWSNIAEGETQPDNPLFGPNSAMNVGKATNSSVVAFEDNTTITLNGSFLVNLNAGQTHAFTSSAFDIIDADKPIFTAGKRGSGVNENSANMTWLPTSWAAKNFSFNATRSNPQKIEVYAVENASIEVKQGSTVLDSLTLSSGNGGTLSWSVYGSYQIVSTGTILVFHYSNQSGKYYDPKPLPPSSNEIIGFPSSSMRLTTTLDGTNYNLVHSNSSTASGSLNKTSSITVSPQGTSSLYQSASLLISADKKISGASFADSNGYCAAPFIPTNLMKKKYAINVSADYVAFASKQAGSITVLDSSDNVVTTLTLTRSGANPNAPYKAYTTSATTAGYRYVSTVPMAAWYQPNTDTNAANDDETILIGTD